MKLLMFGKTGQVAKEIIRRADCQVIALGRAEADLADPAACEAVIDQTDCDAILNAAAYTAVDGAENAEDVAFLINAETTGA
ncbi:MAG: sugar nucleotide-binding protein, partial [Pseudomonadota bacterium]